MLFLYYYSGDQQAPLASDEMETGVPGDEEVQEQNNAPSPQHTTTQQTTQERATQKSKQTRRRRALKTDHELCVEFYEKTCGCLKADGKPCSTLFHLEHYEELRAQSFIMTHDELDLVLMGSLMTTVHNQEDTTARSRHKTVKRQRVTSCFMHHGYSVCMVTFGFLYGVGESRLKAVKKHYLQTGMEQRIHKNTKRLPPKATSWEDNVTFMKFMENYAEVNAILLPGRIPGYKRDDLKLLPCDLTKKVNNYISCNMMKEFRT